MAKMGYPAELIELEREPTAKLLKTQLVRLSLTLYRWLAKVRVGIPLRPAVGALKTARQNGRGRA
jgi:hypothetical protein